MNGRGDTYQSSNVRFPAKFLILALIFLASFIFIKKFTAKAEKGLEKIQKNPRMEAYGKLLDE